MSIYIYICIYISVYFLLINNKYIVYCILMHSIKRSDIVVVRCYMHDNMKKDAIKFLCKAINRYTEEREIASFIKSHFDCRHHTYWHCIVGKHFD
ncbi:dynein light chain [Schistosoma japonicum]|nr:dynein light chain [Schistosoma japonicum]